MGGLLETRERKEQARAALLAVRHAERRERSAREKVENHRARLDDGDARGMPLETRRTRLEACERELAEAQKAREREERALAELQRSIVGEAWS